MPENGSGGQVNFAYSIHSGGVQLFDYPAVHQNPSGFFEAQALSSAPRDISIWRTHNVLGQLEEGPAKGFSAAQYEGKSIRDFSR